MRLAFAAPQRHARRGGQQHRRGRRAADGAGEGAEGAVQQIRLGGRGRGPVQPDLRRAAVGLVQPHRQGARAAGRALDRLDQDPVGGFDAEQ